MERPWPVVPLWAWRDPMDLVHRRGDGDRLTLAVGWRRHSRDPDTLIVPFPDSVRVSLGSRVAEVQGNGVAGLTRVSLPLWLTLPAGPVIDDDGPSTVAHEDGTMPGSLPPRPTLVSTQSATTHGEILPGANSTCFSRSGTVRRLHCGELKTPGPRFLRTWPMPGKRDGQTKWV